MPRPLRLFIDLSSPLPPSPWERVHGFGRDGDLFHDHLRVRTLGDTPLLAASAGWLSVRHPLTGTPFDPGQSVTVPGASGPVPPTVTLYLHPSPFFEQTQAFFAESASFGGLLAFVYRDLDGSSLEAALGERLEQSVLDAQPVTRAQALDLFLAGELDVFVPAGHAIGLGAVVPGLREAGFAWVGPAGPVDPSFGYERMRAFVEEGQPALDRFLALAPPGWPALDVADFTAALDAVTATIYPFSVLEETRQRLSLNAEQWRQIGDRQKAIFRERLLARVGLAPAGSTASHFEFNDFDAGNLFQLEAIVEFYSNCDDPWHKETVPPALDPNRIIDFIDPAGTGATAVGKKVTLPGTLDLSRVRAGDILHLAGDEARERRRYEIKTVDPAAREVTVKAGANEPNLNGTPSAWEINLRPVLVIVDPIGGRQEGLTAQRTAPRVVTVDKPLGKVNVDFDTIYFPADQGKKRAYRVVNVDAQARTLTLDRDPSFPDGSSPWHLPAGLSGGLPEMTYTLTNPDHYDGVAFLVHHGAVHAMVRTSSFTSRKHPVDSQTGSSIRGNAQYEWASFRSGKEFINYAFSVKDPGASYDGVRKARFYFAPSVGEDAAVAPGPPPDAFGKTLIRIHYGRDAGGGTGSEGCLVSPAFTALRDAVIARYQSRREALGLGVDTQIQTLVDKTWEMTKTEIYPQDNVTWTGRIQGVLWLIRPDERPLGTTPVEP